LASRTEADSVRCPLRRSTSSTDIVKQIVAEIQAGPSRWCRAWGAPQAAKRIVWPVRANYTAHAGITAIRLWIEADANGYTSPVWMTPPQAMRLGGKVSRGQRDVLGLYNADQIERLPPAYYDPAPPVVDPVKRIKRAESLLDLNEVVIQHSATDACYNRLHDRIELPPFEFFTTAKAYYSTLAHEIIHWTGHPNRLDRRLGARRYGDVGYAMGELVAELGSAFILSRLALSSPSRAHADYLKRWIRVLGDDYSALLRAVPHAHRAVGFIEALAQEKLCMKQC